MWEVLGKGGAAWHGNQRCEDGWIPSALILRQPVTPAEEAFRAIVGMQPRPSSRHAAALMAEAMMMASGGLRNAPSPSNALNAREKVPDGSSSLPAPPLMVPMVDLKGRKAALVDFGIKSLHLDAGRCGVRPARGCVRVCA